MPILRMPSERITDNLKRQPGRPGHSVVQKSVTEHMTDMDEVKEDSTDDFDPIITPNEEIEVNDSFVNVIKRLEENEVLFDYVVGKPGSFILNIVNTKLFIYFKDMGKKSAATLFKKKGSKNVLFTTVTFNDSNEDSAASAILRTILSHRSSGE